MSHGQQTNGHDDGFRIDDKERDGTAPASELDLHHDVVNPPSGDPLLDTTNLGLGNLSEDEYWLQVQSYESVIYAQTLGDYLVDLAIHNTKLQLGAEGWSCWRTETERKEIDGVDDPEAASRAEIRERGEQIWDLLRGMTDQNDREQQQQALDRYGGLSEQFLSAFWRMLAMRNETSRSKHAQLIDNYFNRKTEKEVSYEGTPQGRLRLGGEP